MSYLSDEYFRRRENVTASINELTGIIRGLIADSALNEHEALFLDTWLRNHESTWDAWPANIIRRTIQQVMADGKITQPELAHLLDVLTRAIGGTMEETGGAPEGIATTLPAEDLDSLTWPGTTFCLTGEFIYGTRRYCAEAIEQRGGVLLNSVTKKLDVLVIGTNSSPAWINSSHGRKIEKAVEYQESGVPIRIITEETWARFL